MNKNAWLIRSALAAAVILTPVVGCREQAPADQSSATSPQTSATVPPSQKPAASSPAAPKPQTSAATPPPARPAAKAPAPTLQAEAPVASPEAALQKLGRNSGLAFSATTKVLGYGDGGVPDPSIGFYEWVVVSPTPLALPDGRQIGDNDVLNLPVATAVQLVESKMTDTKIENPQAAFSIGWQKDGFAFSGTWVRAQGADYLIVQQTRQ
jgi:hypothetical protein